MYKNKSFRILLTEKCNANCKSCFNSDYREKRDMPIEGFKKLCDYFKSIGIKSLKVMGGEPTVHEYFEDAINYAQSSFESIVIFTNAINDKITHITLRESDSIVYNFNFINTNTLKSKFLFKQSGKRYFEIQVSSDSNIEDIKNRLKSIFSDGDSKRRIEINLTLNCMENIFLVKDVLLTKWKDLDNFITGELKMRYNIDHIIPVCFRESMEINVATNLRMCSEACAGLIDTSFNLRYCNQHPIPLINIKKDDWFVSHRLIQYYLHKGSIDKEKINYDKNCIKCNNFRIKCNGGCFMHKEITKKMI